MLHQNTKEWLDLRKNYLGASDAPSVMGVSPWRTQYQLWQEKLGLTEQPQENEAMRRGKLLEEPARRAYINYTGNFVTPEVVFHPEKKFMMASLDGLSLNGDIVVEIKSPGEKDHSLAAKGIVPEKYYPQLQHQLACLNLKLLHYFSYKDGQGVLIEVPRDDSYIETLYKEEEEFWDKVLSMVEPELTQRDYNLFEDAALAQQWIAAKDELERYKKLENQYRELLKNKAQGRGLKGCGIKLTTYYQPGIIDYKSIPELKGVDLSQYRKAPIQTCRIVKCAD